MKELVGIFSAVLVIGGGLVTLKLLWRTFEWEMRWEWRLVRIAIHSALAGSAATVLVLLWLGLLHF